MRSTENRPRWQTAWLLILLAQIPQQGFPAEQVDYARDIKPLLRTKCVSCHGPLKQEGGLRLDTGILIRQGGDSGRIVDLETPLNSEIVERVSAEDTSVRMPPEAEPLTEEQIQLIVGWIKQGAPSPELEKPLIDPREHWAFQRLNATPERTGIDEIIVEKLREAGLSPSPEADRATLIRRLFLDLLGLPPSPEEILDFVADDSPDAWASLVDRVLSSPRYGERWAQHWLDVVRYADTHGFEVNTPRENAWPYRDYVIRAFNEDLPYDQFIREQLAGDAFHEDAATGFLVSSAVLLPGQIGKDEESIRLARQDALDEIVVGTSSAFLGLTIGCARCHDHKFDPITQQDYYSLQSFFAGVEYGDREIRDESYEQRIAEAEQVEKELERLEAVLTGHEPIVFPGETIIVDDEADEFVEHLKPKNGHGENPEGEAPGYRNDEGSATRMPNLSRGRYTWWDNAPGEDVVVYRPKATGKFRLWLSWGVHGSGVHTRDARYVFDRDGDLSTRDDQQELASVDQYYPAGVTEGETEKKPLWSGLREVGVQDWLPESCLILRGGETGTGITADVIVLQEDGGTQGLSSALPRLRSPVNAAKNLERFEPVNARFVRFTSLETIDDNRHEPCIDELEVFTAGSESRNVGLAALGTKASSSGNYSETGRHQLKHINDGKYGNERSWISNQPGQGWAQLEFAEEAIIDTVIWGRDRSGKFRDRLPVRYKIEVSTNGTDWTTVASQEDRLPLETPDDSLTTILRNSDPQADADLQVLFEELESLRTRLDKLRRHPVVYAGIFREPETIYLLRRGDPEQPVSEVSPAAPVVLGGQLAPTETEQQRRLALAEWIASPENPLTARVMVNRIWQSHFGTGLVSTPNDFGVNGGAPSHPELLDWLAARFIESGWSIKQMHRLILLSATYRQSNRIDPAAQSRDADCRLLWRFPSRRLEAEAIRDSMLLASGELNLTMYGPGFDFFKSRGGLSGFPPYEKFNSEQLRRMVYSHKIRMEQVPVFGAFDCPDAGQSMPRRGRSTTALQALNLFNSPFVLERSQYLADSLHKKFPEDINAQVAGVFERILGRQPTATEQMSSADVVRGHGLDTLCRVLFNSNEFLFLP